ncbi:methyltransferase domain-containing protein [Paenibacillus sp.]|uniref:methyltransferase domain-containing protein n=1 Tax=Paenibacillus sp. TaxID=58172 RepID=UPI002D3EF0B3|nr:methyltransferase domain-containing protein [Paenibacillus sp.]HZG86526.1 methyltransferase domain-containing protein [Paenibacillus sp.]
MAQELFLDPPMPDVIEQWRHYLQQLDLKPGDTVLDVGCNTGDAEFFLSNLYPYIGRAVGIDAGEARIRSANERWAARGRPEKIEFMHGDGTRLPFADGTFDKAICAETLEWIEEPVRALMEIERVLKSGGVAIIQHTDWDGTLFASSDLPRTRRIVQAFCDSGPDGTIGRKLPALCREAGFAVVTPGAYMLTNDAFDPAKYSYKLARMITDWLASKRAVPKEELDAWFADLEAMHAGGRYFFAVARLYAVCVKKT